LQGAFTFSLNERRSVFDGGYIGLFSIANNFVVDKETFIELFK